MKALGDKGDRQQMRRYLLDYMFGNEEKDMEHRSGRQKVLSMDSPKRRSVSALRNDRKPDKLTFLGKK